MQVISLISGSMNMKAPRFAIFIDGSNFYATLQMVGFPINYDRILEYYNRLGIVLSAKYFTALPPKDVASPLRNILTRLSYKGWEIVSKETKSVITDDGILKLKGNMDVDIAVHALTMHPEVTDFILFSGDGDFVPVVRTLRHRRIKV